jgi:signal transduction histidine kinase
MNGSTWRERDLRTDLEQATLRVRLAATALGATILLLVPGHDQVAAAALLVGYGMVALVLRAHGSQIPWSGRLGVGMDVLFATALSLLLPVSAAWVLYLFAIGIAALRAGVPGLAVTTAGSVLTYDLVLAVRGGAAPASDLWRIQVLLAFALLAAELTWVAVRTRQERDGLRSFSLAQRDIAATRSADELLDRLVDHAVRSFGATGAWIDQGEDRGARRHARGRTDPSGVTPSGTDAIELAGGTTLRVAFDDADRRSRGLADLRDLAADSRPLLEAATDRVRQQRERDAERRVLDAMHRLARETTAAGVLAQTVTTAQEIAGACAIVRPSDGERVVGDLDPEIAAAIARDGVPPRLGTTGLAVSVGEGLVLVSLGSRRPLHATDLRVLEILGSAAAAALERVQERETLITSATELRLHSEELELGLRARDDAVASAVHELRNPLTSVQAYGQLMSRHLSAVQRQVTQLDSIIEDLLRGGSGSPRVRGAQTVDLARETIEAVARLRVSVPGSQVNVTAHTTEGTEAVIDPGRIAQVLDNVLRNAVKYSPPGTPVNVTVSRTAEEVLIAVSDSGDGIAAEDLERIFDRYARGAQHVGALPGAGIGLAISREIVSAHGGRIWAESAGRGQGSTFTIALPATAARTQVGDPSGGGTVQR